MTVTRRPPLVAVLLVACGASSPAPASPPPDREPVDAPCVDRVDCSEPVGVQERCGEIPTTCGDDVAVCGCAEGLQCLRGVCRIPPTIASDCVPRTECGSRGIHEPCGRVEAGCPGVYVQCGCRYGLSCQGGVCMPPHRPCDPVSPRDVCPGPVPAGGQCGQVSAGCPGATVQCSCAAELTCRDGHCR